MRCPADHILSLYVVSTPRSAPCRAAVTECEMLWQRCCGSDVEPVCVCVTTETRPRPVCVCEIELGDARCMSSGPVPAVHVFWCNPCVARGACASFTHSCPRQLPRQPEASWQCMCRSVVIMCFRCTLSTHSPLAFRTCKVRQPADAGGSVSSVQAKPAPQQQNGSDCGVFVLAFVVALCGVAERSAGAALGPADIERAVEPLTQATVTSLRADVLALINMHVAESCEESASC